MFTRRTAVLLCALTVTIHDSGGRLFGQGTSDFLDAPVARSSIRLRLLSGDSKALQWVIPEKSGEDFQTLTANKTFLTPRTVNVTFLKPNPLRIKLKATSKSVPDPAAATMNDLVNTFLNMVNVVAPGSTGLAELLKSVNAAGAKTTGASGTVPRPPHPCDTFPVDLKKLYDSLEAAAFSPKAVGSEVEGWAKVIDVANSTPGTSGPVAISKGTDAVNTSIATWKKPIKDAEDAIKRIGECADSKVEEPPKVEFVAALTKIKPADPRAVPPALGASPTQAQKDQYLIDLEAHVRQVQALKAWLEESGRRQKYVDYEREKTLADGLASLRLHAISVMIGHPAQRVSGMKTVVAKAEEVAKQLQDFAKADGWAIGRTGDPTSDYVLLRGVSPTFENMDEVMVEVTPLTYQSDSASGAFSVKEGKAISGSLTVRRFSRFAVEPSVGAVFATVTQPKYAAGTNAKGETIVTRTDDTNLSFSPSAMANFVCRCGTSRISPMIQLGASASKDTPGALVGAGFRLFGGKSGLGIGGGAMFAWVKDLKTLQVNQVVPSAAAIEQDRAFRTRPSVGGYFTVQYRF